MRLDGIHLGGGQAGVDDHAPRVQHAGRHQGGNLRHAVLADDHQAIARPQACRAEVRGQRGRGIAQGGIGPGPLLLHQRGVVRQAWKMPADQVMEPEVAAYCVCVHGR
ncbi:hypothetical protein D9M68_452890 [compost metagenome]